MAVGRTMPRRCAPSRTAALLTPTRRSKVGLPRGDPMKRRKFIRLVGGCRARVSACGACSRASACDAIGVLMPHAQDNPVGPPRIAALLHEPELLAWTRLPERGD